MQPKKKYQGLEALEPCLGLIFPSQGLTLARQCIILIDDVILLQKILFDTLSFSFRNKGVVRNEKKPMSSTDDISSLCALKV